MVGGGMSLDVPESVGIRLTHVLGRPHGDIANFEDQPTDQTSPAVRGLYAYGPAGQLGFKPRLRTFHDFGETIGHKQDILYRGMHVELVTAWIIQRNFTRLFRDSTFIISWRSKRHNYLLYNRIHCLSMRPWPHPKSRTLRS